MTAPAFNEQTARTDLNDLTQQFKGYPPARLAAEVWEWAARHGMRTDAPGPGRDTTFTHRGERLDIFMGQNGSHTIVEQGEEGSPVASFTT